MTMAHRSLGLLLVAALAFPATAALTREGGHDVDRAVTLRAAGDFPDDPVRSQAYGPMPDRIARFPDPPPPLGARLTPDGAELRDDDTQHADAANPSHDPIAVLDPGFTPPLPACMRALWAPSTSELCGARWTVMRAVGGAHDEAADRRHSCETLGGQTVLAMTSHGDKPNALQDFSVTIPGGGDVGRMTAQMFIPSDYQPYVRGRLAFGMTVGARTCSAGGCPPTEQTGADIRANFRPRDGSIVLANYSYHLDRDTGARTTAANWEGGGTKVRSFGRPVLMTRALPKGEWITLRLDVVLNTPGRADGSSVLSAYDSRGRLIDSAAHRNVTYRPDASWRISGPALTEMPGDPKPGPKTQAWYFRNYHLATGSPAEVCP